MKVKTLSLLAGAGALMLTGAANAGFLGVSINDAGLWDNPADGLTYQRWHLVADFGDNGGSATFWGVPSGFVFGIENTASDGTSLGSGFFQNAAANEGALPTSAGFAYDFNPEAADNSTFLTIGVLPNWVDGVDTGDVFLTSPGVGFGSLNGVTSFTGTEGGVVHAPPDNPFNSVGAGGQLLLAQFTVLAGENVRSFGSALSGQDGDFIVTSGGENHWVSFDSFAPIPAPGALALLGLAGLVGVRRRRN